MSFKMESSRSNGSQQSRMGVLVVVSILVVVGVGLIASGARGTAQGADATRVMMANEQVAPEIAQDLSRAHTIHPRGMFMGKNRKSMVQVLNSHLLKDPGLRTDECSRFTMERLNTLGADMWNLMDNRLNQVYINAKDGRQLRHLSLSKMETAWENEKKIKKMDGSVSRTLRAKKCREMVMWYVHHLTEDARADFKSLELVLPLLPEEDDERVARDDAKLDALLSQNPRMRMAVEGDNAKAPDGCVKCHVKAIKGGHPNQTSSATTHVFAKNEKVIYNPSTPCQRAVTESFALNNLAVTLVDELTYEFKTRDQVREAFLKAFDFPVKLFAEDVGPNHKDNFFQGHGSYNVSSLINYYLKKGKERRSFHAPIYTYTSKCTRPEVVYNYKEIVEDHASGGKQWKCVVFTTVKAVAVNGVFKVKEKMEKVGFL